MDLVLEDEAEILARKLAALTGEDIEDAVLEVIREKLALLKQTESPNAR
jgi:hypothetical protein